MFDPANRAPSARSHSGVLLKFGPRIRSRGAITKQGTQGDIDGCSSVNAGDCSRAALLFDVLIAMRRVSLARWQSGDRRVPNSVVAFVDRPLEDKLGVDAQPPVEEARRVQSKQMVL